MQRMISRKVNTLFNIVKAIENSNEKAKKVFHKIFLGLAARFMQYGLRTSSYPHKEPRDSKFSTFSPSILNL